jgi:Ca2+-binding EF-hand superfamily protein
LFDKQQQGRISTTDLETIMGSLNRDPSEIREFIENIDPNQSSISFDDFI